MRSKLPSFAALAAALLLVASCGDDDGSTGAEPDVPAGDATAPTDADLDAPPACEEPAPPWPIDEAQTRFAMSLFHYNIQYVIGGLEYFDDDGISYTVGFESEGWDNDRVEDWIVVETLDPILDIYLDHPTWRVDIEMQAYMVEVMADRHPEVLAKLRELALSGQVELISFHYAAQLFLAFPREDLDRSIARTKEVFETHCLPLSGVVFNQEGQAGLGRQRALVELGYEIGVFPKNLFIYQHDGVPWWPWYESEGGTLIVGPGQVDPASGIDVAWDFFDDGELRATDIVINPYLAPLGGAEETRLQEFEDQLEAREAEGYALVTIGDYVRHLVAQGVDKPEAPPLLDGTWQPTSTDTSIHRWLGGRSAVFQLDEEDNKVRTGNMVARTEVAATQALLDHAVVAEADVGDAPERMRLAWDHVFHAEVSDLTGVNPWRGEVLFGLNMNDTILTETAELRADLLAALGWDHVSIDLETGEVVEAPGPPGGSGPLEPSDPPLEVTIDAPGRQMEAAWYRIADGRWRLEIGFGAADKESCDACDLRLLTVAFPRTVDAILYCPGLIEDEVLSHPLSAFSFQVGEAWLPLANGLIGLGDDWWAIKHTRQVHVGARVAPADPNIAFVDQNIWVDDSVTWVFEVVQGTADEALAIANRVNVWPEVAY